MFRFASSFVLAIVALGGFETIAHAGVSLGAPLGTGLPFAEGGLLGIVAATVVAGIYIKRRKR
jgi:hypothetical protein